MKKILAIVAVILFLGGCCTSRNIDDPRPPLMNDTDFIDFTPLTICVD